MGSSERSLVPEWLKSNGSANGGGRSGHHSASSTSHTDTASQAIFSRNKPFRSIGESDSPRTHLARSSSSNSRRSSGISNVSTRHAYSSFSKNHRDKDRDREKERSAFELWDRDGFATIGKDTLRRSYSMVSRKQEVLLPRRVASEVTNNDKINHPYRNGFHQEGGVSKSINKDEFEKQFPTTSVNEKQAVPDVTRVASPVLTVAAQGLPVGSSALVGEGWSALAEVPAVIGSGDGGSVHANQPPEASSASRASSTDSGLNMADALAWSPVTTRTAPLVTTEAQKLEQMTIKQSRQLIPLTPVMPKPMVLSSADKLKPKTAVRSSDLNNTSKIGLQSHASGSAYVASHSPRGAHIMPEPLKTSQVGKLHVLKPPWENSASPVIMDGSALANDVGNKCLDTLATPAVSAAPSRTSNSSRASIMERKVAASNLNAPSVVEKKRMLSHVRSRNEFFNSVRKKSSMNTSSCSEAGSATSVSVEQSSEVVKETTIDTPSSNGVANGHSDCNGRALEVDQESSTKENNSFCTIEVIPDEEEAAFLRSLGWEESCSEDDGLTEEEINTFYQQLMKLRPTLKLSEAVQHPKVSLLHELSVVGGSPRLAPSDSVLKFN